jgi:hypothetical protein
MPAEDARFLNQAYMQMRPRRRKAQNRTSNASGFLLNHRGGVPLYVRVRQDADGRRGAKASLARGTATITIACQQVFATEQFCEVRMVDPCWKTTPTIVTPAMFVRNAEVANLSTSVVTRQYQARERLRREGDRIDAAKACPRVRC